MSRICLNSKMLLACVAALVCGDVLAQGRPSSYDLSPIEQEAGKLTSRLDAATRAKRMAELDAWLRRLVGRYRIDGSVAQYIGTSNPQSSKVSDGIADCILVGDGPGVQCIINVTWNQLYLDDGVNRPRAAYSNAFNTMKPMMMLFGLDPDVVGIQLSTVDETSHDMLGRLIYNKDDLIYDSGCLPDSEQCIEFVHEHNQDPDVTHGFARIVIAAKPGKDTIRMELRFPGQTAVALRLHRESRAR